MAKKRRTPPRYKSGPKKGQFKPKKHATKHVKAHGNPPKRHRKHRKAKRNPKGGLGRKLVLTGKTKKGLSFYFKPSKKRKTRKYRLTVSKHSQKSRKGKRFTVRKPVIRRNPIGAMKSMLIHGAGIFGGIVGVRVIGALLQKYVISAATKNVTAGSAIAKVVPILPAAGAFALAALAPKFIKGHDKILSSVQTGATIALLDAVWRNFVIPSIPEDYKGYLQGDMGEYLTGPRDWSNALSGWQARPALAEYMPTEGDGLGDMEVSEALAGDESDALQRGYAGGILARTVFSV